MPYLIRGSARPAQLQHGASAVPLVNQGVRGTATEDCIRLAWTVMQSEAKHIPGLIEAFGR